VSVGERVVWAGRYQIFDEIAEGGMATVYLAARMGPAGDLPRVVALKKHEAEEEDLAVALERYVPAHEVSIERARDDDRERDERPRVAEGGRHVLAVDLLGVVVGGERPEERNEHVQSHLRDDEERERDEEAVKVRAAYRARRDDARGDIVRASGEAGSRVTALDLLREPPLEQ
jgi:hypothetical protein